MRREIHSLLPFLQQEQPAGGGGEPTDDDNAHGGGEQPESSSGQTPEAPQPHIQFPDEKTFNKRMDREARSRLDKQAQELGYKDHQAMIDAAKSVKDQEAQQQSELDKLKAKADTAEQQARDAIETANNRLIRAEVKSLCRDDDINIVDPDAAYALMNHTEIEIDDDGNVQGVKESLAKLVEAKPWLVVTNQQPRNVPETPRPAGQQSRQELISQEIEAQRAGRGRR